MALGPHPKYHQDIPIKDLAGEEALVLAFEAALRQSWQVGYLSHAGLIAYTNALVASKNSEIRIRFEDGMLRISSASISSEIMDRGRNRQNVEGFIAAFNNVRTAFTAEELACKYEQLSPSLVPPESDILLLSAAADSQKGAGVLDVFTPKKDYFITPILLDLNILIFIIMGFSGINIMEPDGQSMISWGANFKPLTLGGEWWRLITNCFLHFGVFHLLMNMYALVFIGLLLEPYLGKLRFLSAYLLTGIAASITSLWWHDLTISAGASGAIFGMYGVFLALLTTRLIEKRQRKIQLGSIAIFVGYNLLAGLKDGIDNAAHIGGLLSGLAIGYAIIPSLKKPASAVLKLATLGLVSALILFSSFAVYKRLPNDYGAYERKMKEFSMREQDALAIINKPDTTSDSLYISALRDKGIADWNRNIVLTSEIDQLHLSALLQKRNARLREYATLRLKTFELIIKGMEEDTDQYDARIDGYNKRIDLILRELGAGAGK
jgi:rhomboid protease GluP